MQLSISSSNTVEEELEKEENRAGDRRKPDRGIHNRVKIPEITKVRRKEEYQLGTSSFYRKLARCISKYS